VIVWPNELPWLAAHGYHYVHFDGDMFVEFASPQEAAELIEIFYPDATGDIAHRQTRVPYEMLGINPPCDLAFKMLTR
jgi:hypothetical protein